MPGTRLNAKAADYPEMPQDGRDWVVLGTGRLKSEPDAESFEPRPPREFWDPWAGDGRQIASQQMEIFADIPIAPVEDDGTLNFYETQALSVHVHSILLFPRRSIWRDGRLKSERLTGTRKLKIKLDLESGEIHRRADAHPSLRFDLEKPALTSLSDSRVLVCEGKDPSGADAQFVVPCDEILRHDLPSDSLLEAAFSGYGADEAIFNLQASRLETKPPYVQLRKRIYDHDALTAGNIAKSGIARRRFDAVYPDSMQRARLHPAIEARPMSGHRIVTYRARVQPLPSNDGRRVFWVALIRANLNRWPFDGLDFGRDNDSRPAKEQVRLKIEQVRKLYTLPESDERPRVVARGTTSAQICLSRIEIPQQDDPEAPPQPTVNKLDKIVYRDEVGTLVVFEGEEAAEMLSTGKQTRTARMLAKAQVVRRKAGRTEVPPAIDTLAAFRDALIELGRRHGISHRLVSLGNQHREGGAATEVFPFTPNLADADWIFRPGGPRMSRDEKLDPDPDRLRRIQAAEVQTAAGELYLVEFGAEHAGDSMAIFAFGQGRRLQPPEIAAELQSFARGKSQWVRSHTNLFGKTVRHPELPDTGDSIEARQHRPDYVERLADRILNAAVLPYERRLTVKEP